MLTLRQLRALCKDDNHALAGFYSGGELFINDTNGQTIYNKYLEWDVAVELCEDLSIVLTEV